MKKETTHCHSYFAISSSGEILNGVGFVAAPNSDFDPEYITRKLNIEPHETRKVQSVKMGMVNIHFPVGQPVIRMFPNWMRKSNV